MDKRQKEIFHTWFNEGVKNENKPYFGFISLWIAFNAYCFAKYSTKANVLSAKLTKHEGFKKLFINTSEISEGSLSERNGKYLIDIKQPGPIYIVVKEGFREDMVFNAFATAFKDKYKEMLQEKEFAESVKDLRKALQKEDNFYVVNMSRPRDYMSKFSYKELVNRNIIVPFEDINNFSQLKEVLY